MKISVLMAVYNGERTLKETIESILAQTYKDLELVIVNDGSTDKSEDVIKSFKDKRIKYYKQKNSGSPAGPRNKAANEAKGDLLALCDQDDIWYPEKLEKQVTAYLESEDKKETGIIYSRADFVDEKGTKIGISEAPTAAYLAPEIAHQKLLMGIFITACSAIFTKEAFRFAGGFDKDLNGNDEYDLYLGITKKYGVLGLADSLCAWRSTDNSFSHNISDMYVENEKIFKKLEKDEDVTIVAAAHVKNLNRIVSASLLEGNFTRAKEFAVKARDLKNSIKGKILNELTLVSPELSQKLVQYLNEKGKISL